VVQSNSGASIGGLNQPNGYHPYAGLIDNDDHDLEEKYE